MEPKIKDFYFDVETTGFDPEKCGIHQIAFVIAIDGKVVERHSINMRPFKDAIIMDEALEVTGITLEQINAYQTEKDAYNKLIKILSRHVDKFNKIDKLFQIGYNIGFDVQFLRAWFNRVGDKYYGSWFWPNPLDTMSLALQYLKSRRHLMINFKLATVAMELELLDDVEEEEEKSSSHNFHDALFDIDITRQIYLKVTGAHFD